MNISIVLGHLHVEKLCIPVDSAAHRCMRIERALSQSHIVCTYGLNCEHMNAQRRKLFVSYCVQQALPLMYAVYGTDTLLMFSVCCRCNTMLW
jgi:hypothetical protein